ncbi:MAG TPA: hypothetical protein VN153_11445 [Tahibacter sp.]|nr:hypothetical protein [Tahibacter sp.]
MRKIPEPFYQQVLEIALALTNTTEAGDARAPRAYARSIKARSANISSNYCRAGTIS